VRNSLSGTAGRTYGDILAATAVSPGSAPVAEVRTYRHAVMLHGEVFARAGLTGIRGIVAARSWLRPGSGEESRANAANKSKAPFWRPDASEGAALSTENLSRFEAEQRTVMDARSFAALVWRLAGIRQSAP